MEEAEVAARAAGLRYVNDAGPGIRRVRRGKGFSYLGPDGKAVAASERKRIESLAIPPAWTDVWICPRPDGHVQATGRDAKGRKQHRYHPDWRRTRDASKYERLVDFGAGLPALRAAVERDLGLPGFPREKALALVVSLLDRTLVRVGNDEYAASNSSFGLTTLRADHAQVDGSRVLLDFVGKSGTQHRISVQDRRLAKLVRRCSELGGQELFSYLEGDRVCDVGSSDVNDYLRERTGAQVTAKHFRTWGGTCAAAAALALCRPPATVKEAEAQVIAAIDVAACVLGNTRAVCRSSYVHPAILDAHASGALLEAWQRSRATERASRAERAVLSVLKRAAGDLLLAG
jgi:DNA topoisomerase-1